MVGSFNADRECANVGVCKSWPGQEVQPVQSTPWAVPATDVAGKYWNMRGITFAAGAYVRTDLFAMRKIGQKYEGVEPDTWYPSTIRDAGVLIFAENSTVQTDLAVVHKESGFSFCLAPITRDGLGGGYYAVGKNCCDQNGEFKCGDVGKPGTLNGVVLTSDLQQWGLAVTLFERTHGEKIHGESKGIKSPQPFFVRIFQDYALELARQPPEFGYTYVTPLPAVWCVAAIWNSPDLPDKEINFWAAGQNCCTQDSFNCGPVQSATARSGKAVMDTNSDYRAAVQMAMMRYNIKAPLRPYFVNWTEEILVPTPPAR